MTTPRTLLILCVALLTTSPAWADDAQAWERLHKLAEQAGPVETYEASFTQEKFTPLLAEPITSRGRVRIAEGHARWDTEPPYASTMLIHDGELRVYYPDQKTLEVYRLGDRLDAMAASPVPDLDQLRKSFVIDSFTIIPPDEVDAGIPGSELPGAVMRVEMLPRTDEVKEAIESVTVELDTQRATLRTLSITDLDGETTTLTFSDVVLNPAIDAASLQLEVPDDTQIVYPLEGVAE